MNAIEAQLLNNAFEGLGRGVIARRQFEEQERARQGHEDLERQMLALRGQEEQGREADRSDLRANRRTALEAQKAHQDRLEAIQKEGNADKRNAMAFSLLRDMNKNGQLTPEGLQVIEGKFNEMFGPAGIGVKLFQQPTPPTPHTYRDPDSGEPVADYLGNTILARHPKAGVVETREYDPTSGELIKHTLHGPASGMPAAPGAGDELQGWETPFTENELAQPGIPAGGPPETAAPPLPAAPPIVPIPGAAPSVPTAAPAVGQPPRPDGKTDQQLLSEAGAAISRNPAVAAQVLARLKAWGVQVNPQ